MFEKVSAISNSRGKSPVHKQRKTLPDIIPIDRVDARDF